MPELKRPLETLVSEIRARQVAAWDAGERMMLEPLLAGQTELMADAEVMLDLIYAEVLLREEFGERPGVEDYLRRFPSLEEGIRRQFAFHAAVGALEADGSRGGTDSATVTDSTLGQPTREGGTLPTEIGPYEILGEIGRGGMGIVYRARHRTLTTRLAAIKVLRGVGVGEEERARFLAEARAVASLAHPNIVHIYDVSDPQRGDPFVALEYVEGGNLAERIAGTPLPPRDAATLLLPLAEAIAHAHDHGIVHRDLKPANVLLQKRSPRETTELTDPRTKNVGKRTEELGLCGPPGILPSAPPHRFVSSTCSVVDLLPRITDFGLAKKLDADSGQTRTGVIMGTPSYLSPEQASGRNHEVGPLADVYGLGTILYEMLTGRPPFKADTVIHTINQVIEEDPVAPRSLQPGVPRDLETICLKCLNKLPARRYASARDLAADVRRFLAGEPIQARRTGLAERAVKWIRRRPAAALLVGACGLALTALVGTWISFTLRLDEQKREAIEKRNEAIRQSVRAEREKEEARKQKEIALAERAEAQRQNLRAQQLLTLTATAVDQIAISVRASKSEPGTVSKPGTVLFNLACFYARTATTLRSDRTLVVADRERLADQYAASAVRLLRCAEQIGYFGSVWPEHRRALAKNEDLGILRGREDYKELVARLR